MTTQSETLALPGRAGRDPGLTRVRTRALIFTFLTLAAALAAGYLLLRYFEIQGRERKAAVATVPVVVLRDRAPVGTALDVNHLQVVQFPAGAAPEGTFRDAKDVVGRVLTSTHVKGEPVVEPRLARKGVAEGLSAAIPANMRAMAVKVNDVIGVAGFIKPGDKVDVITIMNPKSRGETERTVSKIVLQNIRVLAAGQETVTRNNKPVEVHVVTLLVDPSAAERLALAVSQGEILLTMRAQSDDGQVVTNGITPPVLLAGSLPEPVPPPAPGATAEPPPRIVYRTIRVPAKAAPGPKGPVVEIIRGTSQEEKRVFPKEEEK